MTLERCACGAPIAWHQIDPHLRREVERLIEALGPSLQVTVGERTWLVPRFYIAAHGLAARDLPQLAVRYGWPEVP